MGINNKRNRIVVTMLIIVVVVFKIFYGNDSDSMIKNNFITVTPLIEISASNPVLTKEAEQKVTTTPIPEVTKEIEPMVTTTPIPEVTKEIKPTATTTPIPEVTKEIKPTATTTPIPEVTKEIEPTITTTPIPEVTKEIKPTAITTPIPEVTKEVKPTITITPKPTETIEDAFEIVEYNPVASGYPHKENEWQYGDTISVSVWADSDRKKAVLVVQGSGKMWSGEEALEKIQVYTPWCYSKYCKYVQKIYEVHIGEGITHVSGFDSIAKLEVVTFPSTLKSIGDFAFKNANFKELILPEGLEYIGNRAFLWCNKLEYVKLPSTLKYIGANAFGLEEGSEGRSKNVLKEIEIPKSVEFIDCYAFGYRYHTDIILQEGLDTSGFHEEWNVIPW